MAFRGGVAALGRRIAFRAFASLIPGPSAPGPAISRGWLGPSQARRHSGLRSAALPGLAIKRGWLGPLKAKPPPRLPLARLWEKANSGIRLS